MRKCRKVPAEISEVVLLVKQGEGHEFTKEADASCDKSHQDIRNIIVESVD